ncbi:MAG: rRNA maturation RNase YbeY [Parachlamydiaceae bacterium]|nr:rRNA maturation RNase YbeY [Parachlamydiaceae bacterium]
MEVHVYNTQKRYPIDIKAVEVLTKEVIRAQGHTCHEVTVHFVGTKRICSLHAEYFDDPSVTDCISFPIDSECGSPYSVLGEVFVCPEIAFDYVKKHGGVLYEEITLYVVHGLMHLLGFDDIAEGDCIKMREREHFHMENLRERKLLLTQKK